MRKGTVRLIWAAGVAAAALGAERSPAVALTLILAAGLLWTTVRVVLDRTELRTHLVHVLHLRGRAS